MRTRPVPPPDVRRYATASRAGATWRCGAAAIAAVSLLAACGGGEDDAGAGDQIATLGTTTTTMATTPPATQPAPGGDTAASDNSAASGGPAATAGEETFSTDPEEAMLDYVECMRDHGIDMPDPQPGGGILMQAGEAEGDGEAGAGPALDDEEAATGSMEMDPEQEAEMREQMLEYSQCMRDHGVDMPDPQFDDNGRVTMQMGSGDEPMDQDEFEAANEACGQEGPGIAIGAAPAGPDDDGGDD